MEFFLGWHKKMLYVISWYSQKTLSRFIPSKGLVLLVDLTFLVSVATGYSLEGQGVAVWVWQGQEFSPDKPWNPPILLSSGCQGLFPGVKLPEHKANPLLPTSANVKKVYISTSILQYVFIAYCLISSAQWLLSKLLQICVCACTYVFVVLRILLYYLSPYLFVT